MFNQATASNLSAAESIREAFPFRVEKLPLSGPDNMPTDLYGLFRDDNGQLVGRKSVTRGYKAHQTEDLVAIAEAASHVFEGGIKAKCHWIKNGGHWVTIEPTREYQLSVFGTKDDVFPRVFINASYNASFIANIGWYRNLCRNLAMLQEAGPSICQKIRHTHSLTTKISDLIEDLRGLRKGWEDTKDTIRRMSEVEANAGEFIREVFPLPEEPTPQQVRNSDSRFDAIYNRLANESNHLGLSIPYRHHPSVRANGWLLFNAVQGYVQHDMSRRGRPSRFDRMTSAFDQPEVRRASQLILAA